MKIKELRSLTGLSQKDFGERIGLRPQSIMKYEKEIREVPDTVKRLLRYEFAEYLPEESRLIATPTDAAQKMNFEEMRKLEILNQERNSFKKDLEHALDTIQLQNKTIALLEDQVQLYKDRIKLISGSSSQQTA